MATQFPGPILDQEDGVTPMPAVPNCAAFQRSIVVVEEGGLFTVGSVDPRGVTIEPTTEYIYVTDAMNHLVHIFSQTGDRLTNFGDEHLVHPWGTLIHQDSIYVTDIGYHAIFLFRLPDLKMIKKVGKGGSDGKEFRFPKQLAISPNQYLYVADYYNNRLQILTTGLEVKEKLQHRTMTHPVDVKFSNNEMFVLSYSDSPCVHVFTISGEKTRSLVTKHCGNLVMSPWFFCLDGHNNILVSDLSNHIKVFSQAGDLLHTIRREEPSSYGILAYKNN